ncbi:hypothetical protein XENOCAPTIV_005427 [Xenoophorus captivus]|uniref:Uncharacterized protein n=1 Tax=Xenoophorus captivus TaxID=1517983 RepID=A0ABV0S598_9TELE
MPPQSLKRSSGAPPAFQNTSVSSVGRVCPDPSFKSISVVTPVQFVVQANTQVRVHYLNISSLDVHQRQCDGSAPAQIHHQLLGLPCIDQEVVPVAPVHKVLCPLSVI